MSGQAQVSDHEFNMGIDDAIAGLPAIIALTRLSLILRAVLDAGGADARAAWRNACRAYQRWDEGDDLDVGGDVGAAARTADDALETLDERDGPAGEAGTWT